MIDELKTRTPLQVKLALLIDEVDVLNEYSERVNQRLRSIFMKTFSEHLVAVMSGVGIKRLWKSEGSPWYNFFDEIELTAFTREEAEALIREPVEGVFRYEADAVEAILDAERPQALPHPEVLHPRGQPHAGGRAHHRDGRGRGGRARRGPARGPRRGPGRGLRSRTRPPDASVRLGAS